MKAALRKLYGAVFTSLAPFRCLRAAQSIGFARILLSKRSGYSSEPGEARMPNVLWKLYFGLRRLALQEEGQDLVEYALTILLVAIAAVASANGMAVKVLAIYSYIDVNAANYL
jgi:Flp pilus assembly pilin Flp